MNLEEIENLKRGDFVRDRVTGALFKVAQVDCYEDYIVPDGVYIPLSLEMVSKPDGVEAIVTGESEDEKFEGVGDWDWIYLDMASFLNASVKYSGERIMTCEDLESVHVSDLTVKSDEPKVMAELSEEVKELASGRHLRDIIYPVEEAQANKQKHIKLRTDLARLSLMIKDASTLGGSSVKIPEEMDIVEMTRLFRNAGYTAGGGYISW